MSRAIRQVTGKKIRVHPIEPLRTSIAGFRVLELRNFDNQVLDLLPPLMEQQLNDSLFRELSTSSLFTEVVKTEREDSAYDNLRHPSPTLVLEGAIEDYSPGYVGLRLAELGFNHLTLTVRFDLRDKLTGKVLSSASVTAQDNRATASTKGTIERIAKRIKGLIKESIRHQSSTTSAIS